MLLTLMNMIINTAPFLMLFSMFLLLMTVIIWTLFRDVNPEMFSTFIDTFQVIYDACLAPVAYAGAGNQEYLYTLLISFVTIGGNILFLSYLVAILTKAYEAMQEIGSFNFKIKKFQYCHRFQVAFHPTNLAYAQLVIHPAPLCALNLPILLLSFLPETIYAKVTEQFSIFFFWLENLVYVLILAIQELLLIPLCYIKLLFVIPWSTMGLFMPIFYTVFWFVSGLFILTALAIRDLGNYLYILSMKNGCRNLLSEDEKGDYAKEKLQRTVMNEIRREVIKMYLETKHEKLELPQRNNEEEEKWKNMNFEEYPIIEELT
jgi:hypothetical protein